MGRLRRVLPYLLLFCLLPSVCQAAEKTYQVTETELVQLETSLSRLQEIAEKSRSESEAQKEQLTELKSQLSEAESLLTKQKASLVTANGLLKQYEEEQKKAKQRLKRERTVWMTVAGVLLVRSVVK